MNDIVIKLIETLKKTGNKLVELVVTNEIQMAIVKDEYMTKKYVYDSDLEAWVL